ncbi:MAG: DOMON domain-containing protein [Desulfobacterales bacterium]|nr:DOMON domain-containing protein [Desulfobacterales bacterium]
MLRQPLCLLAAVFILLPGAAAASDYAHTFQVKNMDVHWSIDNDKIHVKLSAKTTGWVAIGFDPEKAMLGADIIIGAVKKGKVKIEDHYGDRKRAHSKDKKLGGENNVMDPKGMEEDGITTISFTRALDTGDKWDKPIDPSKLSRIMIAYGSGRDSFKAGHAYRGVYDVNFTTGETTKIK